MRRVLLLSFDLVRPGEPQVAYAVASLLASLRHDAAYGDEFDIQHIGVNLLDLTPDGAWPAVQGALAGSEWGKVDTIAISCHVWSEAIVKRTITFLRSSGYRGKICLGGPQITYGAQDELTQHYPGADIFISGFAEAALKDAILHQGRPAAPLFLSVEIDLTELPSPYLTNELPVEDGQRTVRMESRRGCPYRCSFCAHRELRRNRVHTRNHERVRLELAYLKAKDVGKINFVDPVFNQGSEYLDLMQYMVDLRLGARLAFQTRFELIRNAEGQRFLELAGEMDTHLEFGLQTAMDDEGRAINRRNRESAIRDCLRELNDRGLSHEVSLIYGLPGQTVASFQASIDFLRDCGCRRIVAFPLMLLRGTELFAQKDEWGYRERPMGQFGIPTVFASRTFSEDDWCVMQEIAESLGTADRV